MVPLIAARAVLALVWAAALVIAVGAHVPSTSSDLPFAAAALLASYPLIDVVASIAAATSAGAADRVLQVNAAISAAAAIAIAIAAFGSDAAATLVAFGAWAAVSGAIQLGIAIRRQRAEGHQLAMLVSGGLSTLAGLSFVSASGKDDAHVAVLGGYMALGAILFLVSAYRGRSSTALAG